MKKLLPLFAVLSVFFIYRFINDGWKEAVVVPGKIDMPAVVMPASKEGMAPQSYIDVFVTRVVDGDTIDVIYKRETQRVRLLYADAPESVKPGTPVQPFAKEAAEFTGKQALGKTVRLTFEAGLRDSYGRLLAHVILKNGDYLNAMLVKKGYARVEAVQPNTACRDYFLSLEREAAESKVGFWSLTEEKRPFKIETDK